ncbi:hypothetical protein ALMP_10010, partial [Streptomyces sp. A012304]
PPPHPYGITRTRWRGPSAVPGAAPASAGEELLHHGGDAAALGQPGHLRVDDLHDGAHGPRPLGTGRLRLLDGLGDDVVQLLVAELLGQVRGQDLALRLLPLGLLGAATLREGVGRLPPLLRLPGDHLLHLVVGELALLLARDLLLGDRGERQPERRGAELVALLDRGIQVFLQLRLERGHACDCRRCGRADARSFKGRWV